MKKKTTKPLKSSPKRRRNPVEFYVEKIELVNDVLIDIPENFPTLDKDSLGYDFAAEIKLIPNTKNIQIFIHYSLRTDECVIYKMNVLNEYTLVNYEDAIEDSKIINENLAVYLIDLSVKHSRGVQAQVTKNTLLSNYPMAFISEEDILDSIRQD